MASFTSNDLLKVYEYTKNIKRCYETEESILQYYYGTNIVSRIIKEEYEDYVDEGGELTYSEFCIQQINSVLDEKGLCGISIENGSGGMGDQTFDHSFILYRADNKIYRIESYVFLYCTRLVPFPTYQQELGLLLEVSPGKKRLDIWNSLFSAAEYEDTLNPLDVEIRTQL